MLRLTPTRRTILQSGAGAVGGAAGLMVPGAALAASEANKILPDGGAGPFPIPWLDKNGSHNQPAGPNLEPSHIYHFRGRVARSAGFDGIGTAETGNGESERILFGTNTTDYGIMDGEYWAARAPQHGAFTHI